MTTPLPATHPDLRLVFDEADEKVATSVRYLLRVTGDSIRTLGNALPGKKLGEPMGEKVLSNRLAGQSRFTGADVRAIAAYFGVSTDALYEPENLPDYVADNRRDLLGRKIGWIDGRQLVA